MTNRGNSSSCGAGYAAGSRPLRRSFVALLLCTPAHSQTCKNPSGQRIDDLVSRMTLEEKIFHGVARSGPATAFPEAIGLAATWDTDRMLRVSTAISDEARAKHHEALRRP
jgi:hypothetical protein